MTIFGVMVAKNEAARYLDCCLSWHSTIVDGIHVFDDQSTDDTVDIAKAHGCTVTTRPDDVPSFLEHEGRFRQAAWDAFCAAFDPHEGDWVLSVDADEFLVSQDDEVDALYRLCRDAELAGAGAGPVGVTFQVPEVFEVTEDEHGYLRSPRVREDGEWPKIRATRLFPWHPDAKFHDRRMACGSEPSYVGRARMAERAWLLHYGYADEGDLAEKYERYSSLGVGHSNAHVESIVTDPMTSPWLGPAIDVYRGRR